MNKRNYEEIITNLPCSWYDLKFKDFKKLIEVPITEETEFDNLFVGMDNSVKAISALTGIGIEELESIPLSVINRMTQRISFLTTEPDVKNYKSSIKWKDLNQITYDNYVTFITLAKSNPYDNLGMLLSNFSIDNSLTEEQVLELPTIECLTGFFLLGKKLKKYLRYSIQKTSLKLIKMMLQLILQKLFKRKAKG